jgi:hypothetical protein
MVRYPCPKVGITAGTTTGRSTSSTTIRRKRRGSTPETGRPMRPHGGVRRRRGPVPGSGTWPVRVCVRVCECWKNIGECAATVWEICAKERINIGLLCLKIFTTYGADAVGGVWESVGTRWSRDARRSAPRGVAATAPLVAADEGHRRCR